jgi:hypothetical protein
LHRRRSGTFAEQFDDRVRVADTGQTPRADHPLTDEALKDRPDIGDKGVIGRHAARAVGPTRDVLRVRDHIRVQEEQSEPRQA